MASGNGHQRYRVRNEAPRLRETILRRNKRYSRTSSLCFFLRFHNFATNLPKIKKTHITGSSTSVITSISQSRAGRKPISS